MRVMTVEQRGQFQRQFIIHAFDERAIRGVARAERAVRYAVKQAKAIRIHAAPHTLDHQSALFREPQSRQSVECGKADLTHQPLVGILRILRARSVAGEEVIQQGAQFCRGAFIRLGTRHIQPRAIGV